MYTCNSTIKCTKASSSAVFRISATGIKSICLARSSVIAAIVKDTKMTNFKVLSAVVQKHNINWTALLSITSKIPEGQKHPNTLPMPSTPIGSNGAKTGETDRKHEGRHELQQRKGGGDLGRRGEKKGHNCGTERCGGPGPQDWPVPSLADTESAGEESLGRLAEGGPGSTTFSAIFNSFLDNHSKQRDGGGWTPKPSPSSRAPSRLKNNNKAESERGGSGGGGGQVPLFLPLGLREGGSGAAGRRWELGWGERSGLFPQAKGLIEDEKSS